MTTSPGSPPLLEARNVTKRFGGLVAVKGFNMQVAPGALYGLIGPNGSGKTTVFNLLTGVYDLTEGEIYFDGKRIDGKRPYEITRRGVARTFQNIRLFSEMTVLENVMTARHLRSRQTLADALCGTTRHHDDERATRERAMELLGIFDLARVSDHDAASLPYGRQRRLEIARALATEPRLLLLDEPAAGMNPQEAIDLMRLIARIREEFGLTILLVEHNMKVVMGISDTVHVIDHGETVAVGTPREVQTHPRVIEAYLGVG